MINTKEIIYTANFKYITYNSKQYIYIANTNGLFEIDSNIKKILDSNSKSIETIYKQLPHKITYLKYKSIIQDLIDNKLISFNLIPIKKSDEEIHSHNNITALTLMMVQECNLKCSYCYAGDGEYNEKGRMNEEIAKYAVDFLFENSGETQDLTLIFFGGEPLLNFENIKRTVLYANQKALQLGKNIHYSMTCNGTLLSNKVTNFILEHNISVQVSVDGNKEAHDSRRFYENKTGSYENIIKKTKLLRDKNKLGVRATITPDNKDYLEIYTHLDALKFRSIYASPAMSMFTDDAFVDLSKEFTELIMYFSNLIQEKKYSKAKEISNIMKMLRKIHLGTPSTYSCGAEVNFFAVDIVGDLYPCHRFVSNKEYKQGNIFKGVNPNKKKDFLIEAHTTNRDNCNNCWAKNLCGGGCHHENYDISGSIKSPPPQYCKLTKRELEEALKLYISLSETDKTMIFT